MKMKDRLTEYGKYKFTRQLDAVEKLITALNDNLKVHEAYDELLLLF